MKRYTIIFLFSVASSLLFGQKANQISIQTGIFHFKFNHTPILNTRKIQYGNNPQNMFGGYLNDSWGLKYERKITKKSFISFSFMKMKTEYYSGSSLKLEHPTLLRGETKLINLSYSRKVQLIKKLRLFYGAGLNYFWGKESLYLKSYCNIYGCGSYDLTCKRNDIGINVQAGIEYQILDWLVVYSDFNFLSFVYLGTTNGAGGYHTGEKSKKYLKTYFGINNIPNRFDLSWEFGIGFNFGK